MGHGTGCAIDRRSNPDTRPSPQRYGKDNDWRTSRQRVRSGSGGTTTYRRVVILDGDGNRVGSSGGGVVPLHAADGWGTSSQFVHWRGTTSAVDLDEVQERSLQEWLQELKRQNDRLPLQLARQFHIKTDCFVARVDESWEHCAAPQRCTDFDASFYLPVVSLPVL